MKITMLGTGHAMVTECYNTCFALQDDSVSAGDATATVCDAGTASVEPAGKPPVFVVDGGGGSLILHQLKHAGIAVSQIHDVFVTHKHIDHLSGSIWLVRAITSNMKRGSYQGEARLYAHPELARMIERACRELLDPREAAFIGERFLFVPVEDGDTAEIIGRNVTFFDLGKECKVRSFGMTLDMGDGRRITCLGDETCHPAGERYMKDSYLAFHEAFCLDSEADIYHPYKIGHSTVKTACEIAERLGCKNLVLYHTEDSHIKDRKRLYAEEGKRYFTGGLFVPDDLESFEI